MILIKLTCHVKIWSIKALKNATPIHSSHFHRADGARGKIKISLIDIEMMAWGLIEL